MDVSLCAKSQSFPLINFHPLSSSSSLISPARARSLRRDFFGCGHNFRPPGLRFHRKCKKIGFRIRSPHFLSRASLDAQSTVIVVSVVAASALAVVSFDYFRKNQSGGTREVSSPFLLVISERFKGIINQLIKIVKGTLDVEELMSGEERKDGVKEMLESRYEDEAMQLQQRENISVPEETLINGKVESPGINTSEFSSESEVASKSFPIYMLSESALPQPLSGMTEISKLKPEGCLQETEIASDFAALLGINQSNAATGVENIGQTKTNKHKKPTFEHGEMDQTISHSHIYIGSGREALHTFCGGNQSASKLRSKLQTLSSFVSLQDSNGFSSQGRKSTANGAKLLTKDFVDTADLESVDRKIPLAYYKEGSTYKNKDFGKSGGFHSEEERRIHTQDGRRESQPPFSRNGIHVNGQRYPLWSSNPEKLLGNDKHDHSREMNAYNRLLKDGRLADCVKFLEDMEEKGLLDMDKVYHARFLKSCQSQKAVKEAFRFTKLIPNPTLSTFNMLMSVCARSQDSEGAFEVLQLAQEAGLKSDCKLYTTLISTCAKSGKVDAMFKVFHEMVNTGVEPNVNTYGALIDGCAKAGQVAKAFGAYGIMRSKNVKPDRVIFNALITACGQSGAVDRAFDVLSEMTAEAQPIDPDHITIGALMKACANSGQVDRAREVYDMIRQYNIKGSPEVYTIAVNSCSETGDWEFARSVYSDMTRKGIMPDEMFLSAMIDVAGHAGKVDAAMEILHEAKKQGMHLGTISYSSLMGACSNAKDWEKALELYEDIKAIKLKPTVSTMNALITSLCDGDQLQKALEVLSEMKRVGLFPNTITYSILLVASEKKDDVDVGLMLFSQAKMDGVSPNLVMCRCLIAMCFRRFEKACTLGEPVLSFNGGSPQIDSKWTSLALMVYRETIVAGVTPTMEVVSLVLGCLHLPRDTSLRNRLIESLGVNTNSRKRSNLSALVDGFGEYDPRAFSLFEEAASFGVVPGVSFKDSPIVVDARELPIHSAEVYLLTVLKGLKNRRAAGAKLPNTIILLPVEKTYIPSPKGERTVNIAGRKSQAVASLLRRLGLRYQGNESYGKIRINGFAVKRWLQPKLTSPFGGIPTELSSSLSRLGKGISHQQRNIRTSNLSLD